MMTGTEEMIDEKKKEMSIHYHRVMVTKIGKLRLVYVTNIKLREQIATRRIQTKNQTKLPTTVVGAAYLPTDHKMVTRRRGEVLSDIRMLITTIVIEEMLKI